MNPRLPGNQITANGTYSVPTITGARYVLSVSGGFGGGSLAVKWAGADGSLTDYTSPATGATSWSFTAASEGVVFVLAGATSPTLTVSVAPESLTAGGGGSTAGLTITPGKTLTVQNSLTLAGADNSLVTIGGYFTTASWFQAGGFFLTGGPVSISGSDTVTFATPTTGVAKIFSLDRKSVV